MYDNSTFIATNSAFAYNSNDLFLNIAEDPNRAANTPFDDIYGICGDNLSHVSGIVTHAGVIRWLLSKINNTTDVQCLCDLPSQIIGPQYICGVNTTYTLNAPLPAGNTISWSKGSNLTYVSGQGTNSYVVKASNNNTSYESWVQATINGPCGFITLPRRNVWAGMPDIAGGLSNSSLVAFTLPGNSLYYNNVCNLEEIKTDFEFTNARSSSWERIAANPTNTTWSLSNKDIRFYFFQTNQTATFRLTVSNTCGSKVQDYSFKSITCQSEDPCNTYSVSPNPSSSTVSIVAPNIPAPCGLALAGEAALSGSVSDIQEIMLYDPNGEIKHHEKMNNKPNKIDLDVSKLKKGVYLLKIIDKSHTEMHRIMVGE